MQDLAIEYLPPDELVAYSGNPRTHSPEQVRQIEKSVRAHGHINPIVIDRKNKRVVAGHGRLLAAKNLGLKRVPVIQIGHLTETQLRAYALADNKIAENAGWEPALLKIELEFLLDADFDVDLTGFSAPEIDVLMGPVADEEEEIPEPPPAGAVVSQLGDIWILGGHRVACGDARDPALIAKLMRGEKARMAISDPPYNVPISGHVIGNGKHQHPEFAMASGEMSSADFTNFLKEAIGAMSAVCLDGALLDLCMDWRHVHQLRAACEQLGLAQINLAVWVKSNAGMGSLYRSQHELVGIFKKGSAPHINNVELGKHGRYRTNVWTYAGANVFGAERDEALAMHPTVKPVAMIADAIMDVSGHGDVVVDFFLGSGTTVLAAERCHRRCYGIELDPRYVDVAIQRWSSLTGKSAVHADSGLTFDEIRQRRAVELAGVAP